MKGMTLLVALVAALCWAIGNLAYAQEEATGVRLVDEDVRIPVSNGNYSIAAKILRPDGIGPYGAVILNHGVVLSNPQAREMLRRQKAELDSASFSLDNFQL